MAATRPKRTAQATERLAVGQLRERLLAWYRAQCRDLPWRRDPRLYFVLLSEFMLQQTRVDQALPYYHRFLKRFPSLKSLAAAPLEEVMKLWEGLGYYRRARFLHATAQRLAQIPQPGPADLDGCPGIGPYTRAAISSIVWGTKLPVVDGNVNRVMARMLALDTAPQLPAGRRAILETLEAWIPPDAAGDWNQGIMELGATVCTPQQPACLLCPWQAGCKALRQGRQAELPVAVEKAPRPHKHAAAAVIQRADGCLLMAQRPEKGLLAGLWEFPGGLLEPGEQPAAGCARAVLENLGLQVEVGAALGTVDHGFTHFSMTLHIFTTHSHRGRLNKRHYQNYKWLPANRLRDLPSPRAQLRALELLATAAK